MRTRFFGGLDLPVEPYDPARPQRSALAIALVQALREASGLIIASPGYHGSVSGLVKNALDYSEDLRTDDQVYLHGRAVGCIVTADGAQAMGSTVATLRAVAHSLRGWPTPYAAMVNVTQQPFGEDGETLDAGVKAALELVGEQVSEFALMRQHWLARG